MWSSSDAIFESCLKHKVSWSLIEILRRLISFSENCCCSFNFSVRSIIRSSFYFLITSKSSSWSLRFCACSAWILDTWRTSCCLVFWYSSSISYTCLSWSETRSFLLLLKPIKSSSYCSFKFSTSYWLFSLTL